MIPIKIAGAPRAAASPGSAATTSDAAGAALKYLQGGSLNLTALPPLSLYIHFPWCVKKCPYCDFNSHEAKGGGFPEKEYLDALRADLEMALPLIWGRKIYTVFIGGGTPSLMSAAGLDRLLSDLRTLLPLDGAAEITMEANPGTFEAEKFKSYRASGINRLSIGIQSFNARHLQCAGPHPRRRRGAPRGGDRAGQFRQLQPRPDVRAAVADAGAGARRPRDGDGVQAAAFVAVPFDDGAEHAVRQISAGAAGRRRQRRHAGHDRRTDGGPRLRPATRCRPMRSRATRRATT